MGLKRSKDDSRKDVDDRLGKVRKIGDGFVEIEEISTGLSQPAHKQPLISLIVMFVGLGTPIHSTS